MKDISIMVNNQKVTVILTSYNHARFLREAIDSVLNQTYTQFDLIVWDDGSTDESWDIIESYSDPRLQTFKSKALQRGNPIRALMSEFQTGEYIAIHHSDDIWEPEKLEKQVAFLDDHPNFGAVFTRAQSVDEDGNPFRDETHFYYKIFEQPNRTRHEWLNYFFYHGNALCHPSVLIRKQCYEDVGVYRYGLAQLADFDMWVRLCLKYEIYVLPEKLVRFRVRNNEMNSSGDNSITRIRSQFEYLQVLYNYLDINDPDDFIKVFPNSIKYFKQEEYDLGFALGMSALESEHKFSKLFGLRLLWRILNEEERAKKVKEIYGFSNLNFIQLTARYDVFSVVIIPELTRQLAERDTQLAERDTQLAERDTQLAERDTQLREIHSSKAWRFSMFLRRVRLFLLPNGSGRLKILKRLYSLLIIPLKSDE